MYQKGRGSWKIICNIIEDSSSEEFYLHKDILASMSCFFETIFYGDHADQFLQENETTFLISK